MRETRETFRGRLSLKKSAEEIPRGSRGRSGSMTDDEERPERLDRVGVDVDGMEEVGGTGMMVCGVTVALSPAAVGNTGMVAIISESFRWGFVSSDR